MRRGSTLKFILKGVPFLIAGSATLLLAYKIQQIKFEFGPSSSELATKKEFKQFLNKYGIHQQSDEAIYQELVEKRSDDWENIRGPRDSEDNREFLDLKRHREEELRKTRKKLREQRQVIENNYFYSIALNRHRVGSSGDFTETPPPPPGISTISREAVRGSEQTPIISSPARSDHPQSSSIQFIADPTTDHQTSFPSSLSINSNQLAQPVSDPAISTSATSFPTQSFYVPMVPGFNQETFHTIAESPQTTASNLSDCDITLPQSLVVNASCSHPADPENKEELVDRVLLAEILELGFEESIAILALSKTKGIGGAETAVNWILEHSNESDFGSDEEQNLMGGVQFSNAIARRHKMVFVVNMTLKMGTGKLAAQVGHATLGVYRLAQRSEDGQHALDAWRISGEMKVVVKGHNTEMLLDLFKQAKDIGLFAYIVSDAGLTQVPVGSRTVLGIFGPSETVDMVTGELKLL
ncbi:unnamed protein product [Thelazia callipaeda]|uniref:peptidyl-tRNA hydrolase n=1 Tax=Thelazia callipaeda TaxID=103827 RepID=A0A0N5CRN1_THECL|nr:unnamed protein product [Thelazia callipaeda]